MDTSVEQAQHILAHLQSHKEEWYLRLQKVCHTDDFKQEYKAVYQGEPENCVYLYNSAKWYSRFLDDLKYKKFKGTTLEKVADGIWKVSGSATYPTMVDWFRMTFIPYLRNKLTTYIEEDDEDPVDLLACLKTHSTLLAMDIHKVIKRVFDEAQDCYTLVLQRPEKVPNVKDTYVLTYNELMAILLSYDSYKLGPNFDRPVTGFKIWKEDHYYINKTVFTENDILANLHVLGISQDKYLQFKVNDFAYKDIRSGSLLLPNSMVAAIHQPNWKVGEQTVPAAGAEEDAIYGYEREPFGCELDLFDAVIMKEKWEGAPHDERLIGTANAHIPVRGPILPPSISFELVPPKEVKKPSQFNLYVNAITKEIHMYATEFKMLTEMELLSNVTLHTTMAYEFFTNVCDNIHIENLMEDVMEIGRMMDKMLMGMTRAEGSVSVPGGSSREVVQKYHTKAYVDKHKDDDAELAAAVAIRNVNGYLEGVMEKSKINSNRIGQDLVELGVKKVRRSRGFVYGLTEAIASVNPVGR